MLDMLPDILVAVKTKSNYVVLYKYCKCKYLYVLKIKQVIQIDKNAFVIVTNQDYRRKRIQCNILLSQSTRSTYFMSVW